MNTNNVLNSEEISSVVKVQYDTGKEGNAELSLKRHKRGEPVKMSAEAKLHYPGREMSYLHTIEMTAPRTYEHKLNLQLDAYTKFEIDSIVKTAPRLELQGTIKTPLADPITVQGHVKPELFDFESLLYVRMAGQPHSLEVQWKHNPTRNGFSTTADVDFLYHEMKVTADAQLTKRGSTLTTKMETKWDALRDERKKVSISGELEATSTPTMQIKATWWPREFVEINGNFKNEKPGYWSNYGDLEGHLTVKSSIRWVVDFNSPFIRVN